MICKCPIFDGFAFCASLLLVTSRAYESPPSLTEQAERRTGLLFCSSHLGLTVLFGVGSSGCLHVRSCFSYSYHPVSSFPDLLH